VRTAYRLILLWATGSLIAMIVSLFCEEGMIALYCFVSFGLSGLAWLVAFFVHLIVGETSR